MSQSTAGTNPNPAGQNVRKRLGRGLSSLLSAPVPVEAPADDRSATATDRPTEPQPRETASGAERLHMIALRDILPNEYQPRRNFDEASLEALAGSIREAGLMQPVVVRPRKQGSGYELIAGERRWRAAQKIGLARIPAVIREVDGRTAAQWALIENIQREDLNAVERARAFRRLADEFSLTHQAIAERVGLDRTSVTNHLRLLELDGEVLEALAAGALGMGHGRALLGIANNSRRRELALRAVNGGWSVRELERRARVAGEPQDESPERARSKRPAHIEDLERRLAEHLGSSVRIHPGPKKGSGKLVIDFFTLDEFEGLLTRLGFDPV